MRLPPPLSWLYDGWMGFSSLLGKIMSVLILTILWLVGFGAYGIILKTMRCFRKERSKASYWSDVQVTPQDSLYHQF